MLFTDVMRRNEAVVVVGAERTTKHSGYGAAFQFLEDYRDTKELDTLGRLDNHTVAIDALLCLHD